MRTIQVVDRQNLIDIAVQYYGSAAAVINLCIDNNLELDANLIAGQTLRLQDTYPGRADGDVADYILGNNIVVVSLSEDNSGNVLGDNNGAFIITNDNNYIRA